MPKNIEVIVLNAGRVQFHAHCSPKGLDAALADLRKLRLQPTNIVFGRTLPAGGAGRSSQGGN